MPGLIALLLLGLATSQRLGRRQARLHHRDGGRSARSTSTVTATGNLRPTNQVQVGSEVSGRIDHIYVDVNDRVARGQVMARINTDVIEDQIRQAQANLDAARAQVAQARATLGVDTAQLARLQEVYRLSDGKVPSKTEMRSGRSQCRARPGGGGLGAGQRRRGAGAALIEHDQPRPAR